MQHFFNGFKHKCASSSLNIDGIPENSSDLERGAAPRSIAGEFSGIPSLVQKLQRRENTGLHIHTAPFGTRSQRNCVVASGFYETVYLVASGFYETV